MVKSTFTLTLDLYGDYISRDVTALAGLATKVAARTDSADIVVPLEFRKPLQLWIKSSGGEYSRT
jgi:hypothetical protein